MEEYVFDVLSIKQWDFTLEEAKKLVKKAMENAESIETEDEIELHKAEEHYETAHKKYIEFPQSSKLIEKTLQAQRKALDADKRVTGGTMTYSAAYTTTEKRIFIKWIIDYGHQFRSNLFSFPFYK